MEDLLEKLGCAALILLIPVTIACALFLRWDYSTGANVGTLTAVDKTFWGTYEVYINDGQYSGDSNGGHTGFTYCINKGDTELATQAMELVGKRVRVDYPEPLHIGFYTWDKCSQAPLKSIQAFEDK